MTPNNVPIWEFVMHSQALGYEYKTSSYFEKKSAEKFLSESSLAVLGQVSQWWIMHWIKAELPPLRGHNIVCHCFGSTCCPASVATGWLPLEGVSIATVPCNIKPNESGFYLVLSNNKSTPHSTAPAAGTCWRPSVKGVVYVVSDPELISIPPPSLHYCSFY